MKFPFKKALVTGGAGFIGCNLVEKLLEIGVRVVSLDNYSAGCKENIDRFLGNPLFEEVDGDIRDVALVQKIMKDVDIIFHEAVSKKTVCLKDPGEDLSVNALGTLTLLEAAKKEGVKKFIYASTGSVYGEAQFYPVNEDHPVNPTSYYGVSKLAAEKYVTTFHHLYKMDVTVLRHYHVYGPWQDPGPYGGVVAIFCRQALAGQNLTIFGDGTQERSFTYVDDLVNLNLKAAVSPDTKGKAYNCASGVKIPINELAAHVIRYSGKKLKIEYGDWTIGDIKVFDVDNSRIRALGVSFPTPFSDGLKYTYDWFEKTSNWTGAPVI